MSKKIPLSFLPPPLILAISSRFYGIGKRIGRTFPYLELELQQAEMDFDVKEYGAVIFTMFILYFLLGSVVFYVLATRFAPDKAFLLGPTIGAIMAFFIMIQITLYPKIKIKKKVRDIERNLIFALRTMLVQIKSGVSLFNAMNVITEGDYGQVSKEFEKAIEQINTGESEQAALEKIAANNPSHFFRRAVWQIVNGMKAGTEVGDLMQELVSTMVKEEGLQIRQYGSDLRMLSLMYMMLGVIVPALGLTLLIVLSSFPQIKIPEIAFWAFLIFILVGQFMYLGIIKSKRPNLIEG